MTAILRRTSACLLACCLVVAASCSTVSSKVSVVAQGNGSWEISHPFDLPGFRGAGVSCGTADNCLVRGDLLDGDPTVYRYDGQTLRKQAGPPGSLDQFSCYGPDFCLAMGDAGNTWAFHTGGWSANGSVPDLVQPFEYHEVPFEALSCGLASFCMVTSSGGSASVFSTGRGWSAPIVVDPHGNQDLSCVPGTMTCVAIDLSDHFVKIIDGTVTAAGSIGDRESPLFLSCPTVSFCVTGDGNGNLFRYDGSRWLGPDQPFGAPPAGPGSQPVSSVACASPTFCMAAVFGQVSVFDGRSWGTPVQITGRLPPGTIRQGTILQLSCPSPTFCVAVGGEGLNLFAVWKS